jgi:CDGSH-type Zn-finger protein
MSDPVIADSLPIVLELEPGTHWWCACGRSQNQPFCDGSHAGTDFEPVAFEITEKRRRSYCRCKHAAEGPFCDGTHATLE